MGDARLIELARSVSLTEPARLALAAELRRRGWEGSLASGLVPACFDETIGMSQSGSGRNREPEREKPCVLRFAPWASVMLVLAVVIVLPSRLLGKDRGMIVSLVLCGTTHSRHLPLGEI